MSINRVVISGNLTRNPETRQTQTGMTVMTMGVAVNDRRKNPQTGEWEDYPNYIDCTMFGARASSLSNYLTKGTKVAIEGRLRWSQWEKDGQKRSKVEVIVEELEFMTSRNGGGNAGASPYQSNDYGAQAYGAPAASPSQGYGMPPAGGSGAPIIDTSSSVYDDDIPF